MIDTPGLRELQLWDVGARGDDAFEDIAALADGCRFRDCQHDQEPGCAVKAAVASGQLDAARYASYLKLTHERSALERRTVERQQMDARRPASQAGPGQKPGAGRGGRGARSRDLN